MRIGIDARFYGLGGKGLGRYAQKLIEYLEKIDQHNNYFVLLRRENWDDYQPANIRFTKVLADYRWYSLGEQLLLPLKIRSLKLDVMHFTHFNVPLFYRDKFIVTVHDLILTKYPTERATTLGPLIYKLKHFAYRLIIKHAVTSAKKIIAVSEYTKHDIIKYFHIPAERIGVTYEGVDPLPEGHQTATEVLEKYHLKKPYLLYVGNVYPHKNAEGLLRAFKLLVKKTPNIFLVLVGREDYFFSRLKKEAMAHHLDKHVVFTGFVPDDDLRHFYQNASLYVFPSFCEGFGLPALEACRYGLPVVASNNSSLPEVLANAALYFDPSQPAEIAEKINYLLVNPEKRRELTRLGLERVKFFSWGKMAWATLKLYQEV